MADSPQLNVDPKLFNSVMSGPINGQSWSHAPKSQPWEKPSQFSGMSEAMNMLMMQLTEPEHLKGLLNIMESEMPIEAIARTILFTGFTLGKWSPDLAMLMYKPLMMSLIAIAHRAKIKNVPVVMKESMDNHLMGKVRSHVLKESVLGRDVPHTSKEDILGTTEQLGTSTGKGFFDRKTV